MTPEQLHEEAILSDFIGRTHISGGTDPDLFAAVDKQFGPFTVDLAATAEDTLCPAYITPEQNALVTDWKAITHNSIGWLNPPAGDLLPWANKMVIEAQKGVRFCALLPLSLDVDWCWQLLDHAQIYVLTPRLTYDGLPIPLAIFAFNCSPRGFSAWFSQIARFHWRSGSISA